MKTKVLFVAAMAATMLAACSSNSEERKVKSEELASVSLTFTPYDIEPMTRDNGQSSTVNGQCLTRATVSIAEVATHLDVWLYEGGTEATAIHQTNADDGFGSITVTLDKTKTYTLVAVGHKAAGAATLTSGVVAFPDEKVSHAMIYQTTFSPATTTSIQAEMTRIVGQFRFEITDAVPDDAYTMQFSLGSSFTRWNVTSAAGANAIERTTTFNNFSRDANGANFTVYIIPTNLTATDEMDITVTAKKQNGDELQQKTFQDVPIKAGYKTTYRGQFFTDQPVTSNFLVDDWTQFDTVTF